MTSSESTTTRLSSQEYGACTLIEDLLPLYMEGEVSPSSRDLIVEHLARCERCAGFLAGAQSVHAQLRRDTNQRISTAADSQSEQQVIAKGQWFLTSLAVLLCCGVGGVGSAALWYGLYRWQPLPFVGGALLAVVAFGLLIALARSRSPLTLARTLVLLGSCAVGSVAPFLMIILHQRVAVLTGLIFCFLGLGGTWLSVLSSGTYTQTSIGELKTQSVTRTSGGVLVGFAFVVLGGISINTLFWSPSVALVMVGQVFHPQPLHQVEFWFSSIALTLIGIILMLASLRGSRKH